MYSPRIHEILIPVLYRLGQHQKRPMTEVVNELLLDALERTQLPPSCLDLQDQAMRVLRPDVALEKAA